MWSFFGFWLIPAYVKEELFCLYSMLFKIISLEDNVSKKSRVLNSLSNKLQL